MPQPNHTKHQKPPAHRHPPSIITPSPRNKPRILIMLSMSNSKLFSLIDVSIPRHPMRDFEIKHPIVVRQHKLLTVEGCSSGVAGEGEGGPDVGVEHVDFELDGVGGRGVEGSVGLG